MLSDWKILVVVGLGLCALGLTVVNITIYSGNRDRQAEVVARQQLVSETAQLTQFSTQFIQALANLAAQTNDANIRQLLADYGVTYTVNETTPENDGE